MKRPIKILPILLTASLISTVGRTQPTVWQKSSQWTMYNIRGAKFYKVTIDSLGKYNNRPMNDDSMRAFLAHSTALSSEKPPMWMGAYVASCSIDQKERKIDISSYGGFFFDEAEKKYYTVPQEDQKEWLNYLADCAGSIPSKK
jgi:hypothetical protein